jgi:hypothetical protein
MVDNYRVQYSYFVDRNGFMKSDNNIVNSSNVKLNRDGTFTLYFGSVELCGDVPNRVDTTEGWNFLMRIYRPGKSVLNGDYKLPAVEVVTSGERSRERLSADGGEIGR